MFKWTKLSGCNCHPVGKGCERYLLNVGDVWGGTVESHPCKHGEEGVYWEGWYTVAGKQVSGQSGGGSGRDEHMTWIERRISDALAEVAEAQAFAGRRIVSALVEVHPDTGEWFQREVR